MKNLMVIAAFCFSFNVYASLKLDVYLESPQKTYQQIAREVTSSTSITMSPMPNVLNSKSFQDASKVVPWLWVRSSHINQLLSEKNFDLAEWLKRGGMLILLHDGPRSSGEQVENTYLESLKKTISNSSLAGGEWRAIPAEHSLLRSYYLLKSLPTCDGHVWNEFRRHDRPLVLSIPYDLVSGVADNATSNTCLDKIPRDIMKRLMVNIAMLAMTTHYKSDQIHLPEILKRLR